MKGDGQAIDLNQRLHSYQPQEAHGWWDRFGKEMVWGALQGLAGGGLGGAIGGAGYGAARGALNPRAANDDWKRKQLRESDINVKNVYDRRDASSRSQKEAAEIEKLAADTNLSLVRAREIADTAKKGRERKIIERRDGVYAVDPLTLKSEKVADIPEEAGPTGNTSYFERPDGVYGVNPQHPDGFKLGGVPGKPETVEDVSFGNQNIGRVIKRKQAEQSKIAQAMMNVPQTIEEEDIIKGTTTTKKNPAYQDLENRYRTLDDDIDELNTQLRSPKKTTMIPAQGAPKNDPLRIFED
jgi:hypothetical protein